MARPADPQAVRELEEKARACEQAGDYLGALDLYEEIAASTGAEAQHLTALGYCYLKNRQRQNAKEAWLRAIELDARFKPVREALDKFFPGWERQAAKAASHVEPPAAPVAPAATTPPPPPPPPPSFAAASAGELTMETIMPASAEATRISPPLPTRSASETRFSPPPQPRPVAPEAAPARTAATQAQREEHRQDHLEGRVNWEFVLADVAEEAAYARS